MRNFDDQTEVRSNHQCPGLAVALLNLGGKLDFLVRSQKRDLPDLTEVNLYAGIAIFSGHITFLHEIKLGAGPTSLRRQTSPVSPRSDLLAFGEVVNNVKYSGYYDICQSFFVQSFP